MAHIPIFLPKQKLRPFDPKNPKLAASSTRPRARHHPSAIEEARLLEVHSRRLPSTASRFTVSAFRLPSTACRLPPSAFRLLEVCY
ncbi:hypothetical protein R6Q59_002202 [Mikania micrantha]